ncbi:tubulin-folding cofactor B [Folsomia candida]|uniref:Tubulin-folding cofactor B n=1 Tax=Folsomia candida TaxID=158441 RepID=A0A226ESC9_FOLCA|nr:tubulin-folding cofactor B [Folsomia candida]OXA60513.1 Tubulin-folding cofactor B [Folsomia candida]
MSAGDDCKQFVAVTITSNLNSFHTDRRFPGDVNIANLKGKLELLTGCMMSTMKLELRDNDDELIQYLSDDTLTLAQLGVQNGMKIHVIDTSNKEPEDEEAADVSYKLSTEEYEQREESMRKFMERNKLGRFDEEKAKRKEEEEENETKLSASIKVGDRCEVRIPGNPVRRGQVKFVGKVHFKEGAWVGIQYDEPMGKNDGAVGGKRYFECKQKYGSFIRPSNLTVGDFPELDDELDEI